MADEIHAETEPLAAAVAAWRADVPATVAFPELPAAADVEDSATAGVLAAMAHWPGEHATMGTHREASASALHTATTATIGILTETEDENAAVLAAIKDV